jgi:hypothetical protein
MVLAAQVEVEDAWPALGVPIYPGATLDARSVSRVRTTATTTATVAFTSADSVDRVAGFYRDAFGSRSASQQLFDDSTGTGVSLMLSDGPQRRSITVDIDRLASGARIGIRSDIPTAKLHPWCTARSGVCAR